MLSFHFLLKPHDLLTVPLNCTICYTQYIVN